MEKRRFKAILKEKKLVSLRDGCNQYLIPHVLCPWGCSEFIHCSGCLSFDAVYHRFFAFTGFTGTLSTAHQKECLHTAREDTFNFDIGCHLFNPKWVVNMSVYLDSEVGPLFLSCHEHHGGTKAKYFHIPKTGNCLPPLHGDQLSFVVLRARTLHKTKAHTYSDTYQMNMFQGNYSGVDSTWVSTSNRQFNFQSHLSDLVETRAYNGRDDIKGLAHQFSSSGVAHEDYAKCLDERACQLYTHNKERQAKRCEAATMMTLTDCINLQKGLCESDVISVMDGEDVCIIRCLWPLHLIRMHTCDGFGGRPEKLGPMKCQSDCDTRLWWILSHIMLNVSNVWELARKSVQDINDWQGPVLAHLSRVGLKQRFATGVKDHPYYLKAGDDRAKAQGMTSFLKEFTKNSSEGYNARMFKDLFYQEESAGIVQFLKFRYMQVQIIEDDCDLLWYLNPEKRPDVRCVEESLEFGGDLFELRCM